MAAPIYALGDELEMDWPLEGGGLGSFRATVIGIAARAPERRQVPGAFRYRLRWRDGTESWVGLRLPHRAVNRTPGAWQKSGDEADHAETPLKAYEDVARFLDAVASSLGKDRGTLKIYDPYFCMGNVVKQLGSLGFYNVYNQPVDFYAAQKASLPEYDVLVTNPPYSGEHVKTWDRLYRFAAEMAAKQKPSFLLVPNYTIETQLFDDLFSEKDVVFMGPEKRYVYRSPPELRPKLRNKQRKYVAPYVTLWVLVGLPKMKLPTPPGCCPPLRRKAALPPSLRGSAKGSSEAMW